VRDIKVLHLEPTDVCQAACSLCLRETDKEFNKNLATHLSMEQILNVFDQEKIKQLDKMFMCGIYGDPAAGKHTLDIYQKFRQINSTVTLGMNTNGGLQNQQWWEQLANIFNQPGDYVVFSIDGLEDTNHMYRKNVSWKKIMQNVQAFVNAGGSAHWDMLVYQHNEHQIDHCKNLAKEMKFSWFRAKVSKRPFINGLAAPSILPADLLITPTGNNNTIDCHALIEKSLYIDARGQVKPCCWLGDYNTHITQLEQVAVTWNTKSPHPVCKKSCSLSGAGTVFKNQWRVEEQLC
jgi:MoaA/NifB/PqqE/SkfB family radical SAM enzyme